MGLIDRLRSAVWPSPFYPAGYDYPSILNFNGITYPLHNALAQTNEPIGADFVGLVQGGYKTNGVVFACIRDRALLLSQARFQFQQMRGGTPGDLFGTADLTPLEHPEPGKVTADLLTHASVDCDLAGNSFLARRVTPDGEIRIKRLRPDWVDILMGSQYEGDTRELDAEVVGFIYYPGGRYSGIEPEFLLAEEVAHHAPIPDPLHRFRGMSWLTPIISDLAADSASNKHKLSFFEHGATVNLFIKTEISEQARFDSFIAKFKQEHEGIANAYKTLFGGAGMDVKALGADFQQIEFAATQAKAETRIVMASGLHPVIVGSSEGLAGSSLNQGNFMAARRLVADKALRPWWGSFSASLEVIVPAPGGSRLWYDAENIPFLREDAADIANIQQINSQQIKALLDAGFNPDAVVDAVISGDLARLKGQHTGLFSVQLLPPDSGQPEEPTPLPVAEPEPRTIELHIDEKAIVVNHTEPSRTVLDYDDDGILIGSHEEVVGAA